MTYTAERDKRLEELRRKVNDTMTYRKMFRLHGSDELCLDVLWLLEEIERLQAERGKAIEGLRWYADLRNHSMSREQSISAVTLDRGHEARRVLREVGVTDES